MVRPWMTLNLIICCFIFISCSPAVFSSPAQTRSTAPLPLQAPTLHRLDIFMPLLMRLSKVPSVSACIIAHDNVLWSKGYGYYDVKNKKLATDTTMYNIASISKTITATALLQLYDQHRFTLDDDINAYLPFSVRNPQYPDTPITFRMLLAHQSGLAEDPVTFYKYFAEKRNPIPLYPWIETYLSPTGANYSAKIWSGDAPGQQFHYANVGYALIGYLVEQMTGEPFYKYCNEHIFQPLQMYNTSFLYTDINMSKLAMPYGLLFHHYFPYGHYCYVGYPCGGVQTTVLDYSHFMLAQMNHGTYHGFQLLNATTIDMMHTEQYAGTQYGFGWVVWNDTGNTSYYGHTGGDFGVSTCVTVRVNDDSAILYFTNGEPRRLDRVIAWNCFDNLLFSTITQ